MIQKFKKIYHREMYFPRFFALLFNPFYFARRGLAAAMIKFKNTLSGNLLDVGCGSMPYRNLFFVSSYRGLEIDTPFNREKNIADDYYDGNRFPYEDQIFESILCNQVLEHVFNPDCFLKEINRVLATGGRLLLTVPFVWDEHEQPNDYARYTSFGLKSLLEKNGFMIIHHQKLSADASVLFQLINAYLFKIISTWPIYIKWFFILTIIAIVNIFGVVVSLILPKNEDLYLDHVILAEKIF